MTELIPGRAALQRWPGEYNWKHSRAGHASIHGHKLCPGDWQWVQMLAKYEESWGGTHTSLCPFWDLSTSRRQCFTYIRMSQREQLILHFINGLILAIPGGYISIGSFNTHSCSIKVRIWQIKRQITRQVNHPIRKCWSWDWTPFHGLRVSTVGLYYTT